MASVRSLIKDTAVYGLSSIVGRFLNWCLVPMYTYQFTAAQYGVVTNLYAYVALILIILTYGMETGFFRFANHERWTSPSQVYSTTLLSLGASSTLFIIIACLLSPQIAAMMDCGEHPSYIWMMAIAVGIDAYTSIPFAYLRYRRRPYRFATLKLIAIALNILLNLFFIIACPWLMRHAPATVAWFYDPAFGIGYIFLANLISSAATLLLVIPEIMAERYDFNRRLLAEMLRYSFPLLILGIAGIMNQTIDKILFPFLISDHAEAMRQLGIYGANYKIAIIMVMFIQAFRFAYEPFIFARSKDRGEDRSQAYSDAMTWFVLFALFIFLGVIFYLDILRYFISPRFFEGLRVVPLVMLAELAFGIFFNLSVWYKISDRTIWGTWFSILGLAVTVTLNIILVPRFGYMGCAWAALCCYSVMMVASWAVGRRLFPIEYDLRSVALFFIIAFSLWGVAHLCAPHLSTPMAYTLRTILLILYSFCAIRIARNHNLKKSAA